MYAVSWIHFWFHISTLHHSSTQGCFYLLKRTWTSWTLSLFSALSLWKLELLGKSFQFTLWHSTKSCLWESESSQTTKAYYFEGRRLYSRSAFFSGGPSTSYSSGGSLGLLLLTNQGPLLTIRYAIWIMLSCQLFISLACYWSVQRKMVVDIFFEFMVGRTKRYVCL